MSFQTNLGSLHFKTHPHLFNVFWTCYAVKLFVCFVDDKTLYEHGGSSQPSQHKVNTNHPKFCVSIIDQFDLMGETPATAKLDLHQISDYKLRIWHQNFINSQNTEDIREVAALSQMLEPGWSVSFTVNKKDQKVIKQ